MNSLGMTRVFITMAYILAAIASTIATSTGTTTTTRTIATTASSTTITITTTTASTTTSSTIDGEGEGEGEGEITTTTTTTTIKEGLNVVFISAISAGGAIVLCCCFCMACQCRKRCCRCCCCAPRKRVDELQDNVADEGEDGMSVQVKSKDAITGAEKNTFAERMKHAARQAIQESLEEQNASSNKV